MSIDKLLLVTTCRPFGNPFPKGESPIGDPKPIPLLTLQLHRRASFYPPIIIISIIIIIITMIIDNIIVIVILVLILMLITTHSNDGSNNRITFSGRRVTLQAQLTLCLCHFNVELKLRRVCRRHEHMVGVNMVLAEYHQIQTWLLQIY